MAKANTAEEVIKKEEAAAAEKPKPVTGRENWVYVTIPKVDMFGEAHQGVWQNQTFFAPGSSTLVSPEMAKTVEASLQRFVLSQHRQMSPRRDLQSISDAGGRGNYVPDL